MHRTALLALVAGCLTPDPETSQTEQFTCSLFQCGGDNSPNIHGTYFHELNRASTAANPIFNTDGFAYLKTVDANNLSYTLTVSNGKLVATTWFFGQITKTGSQLVGLKIVVQDEQGLQYAMRIDEVNRVGYWTANAVGTPIETYRIRYFDLAANSRFLPTDLCSNATEGYTVNGPMNGHIHDVVIFEADRVAEQTRTVFPDSTGQWFSFGCAGGALAKMYLTAHVAIAANDSPSYTTTLAQRQAILKMFSADYCGGGMTFTVSGQPLNWADDRHLLVYQPVAGEVIEARWDQNGATCLSTPRATIAGTPANLTLDTNGDSVLWHAILTECALRNHPLPACGGSMTDATPEHLVSANPPPP